MVEARSAIRRLAVALVFAIVAAFGLETARAVAFSDSLYSNDELLPGEYRTSSNGKYRFIYQWDGNLVLYDLNDIAMWASNTHGTSPGRAVMQADGNFVIYDSSSTDIWDSNTAGNSGAYLIVQDDGNVVIYNGSTSIWHTDSATGRWVWSSGDNTCTWDLIATGDNECGPYWIADLPEISGEEDAAFEEVQADEQGFSGGSDLDDYPQDFDQQTGVASCSAYTKSGNVGYIAVQTNPTDSYLHWGAYMYNASLNFGFWKAQVLRNGQQVDFKAQAYPPHGSLPPAIAPIGSLITINVVHYYWSWSLQWVWQGWGSGREFNWWGFWRPAFVLVPQISTGSLTCRKTM